MCNFVWLCGVRARYYKGKYLSTVFTIVRSNACLQFKYGTCIHISDNSFFDGKLVYVNTTGEAFLVELKNVCNANILEFIPIKYKKEILFMISYK